MKKKELRAMLVAEQECAERLRSELADARREIAMLRFSEQAGAGSEYRNQVLRRELDTIHIRVASALGVSADKLARQFRGDSVAVVTGAQEKIVASSAMSAHLRDLESWLDEKPTPTPKPLAGWWARRPVMS